MSAENKSNAIAQYGPVGAPVLGLVLAVVFVAVALVTSSVTEKNDALKDRISGVTRSLSETERTSEIPSVPLTDSVSRALNPVEGYDAVGGDTEQMLDLPVTYYVTMESPPKDDFATYDLDGDEHWTPDEYSEWPDSTERPFSDWDRIEVDGLISRKEFNDPPTSDREAFDDANTVKAEDGEEEVLSGNEVTPEDLKEWDRFPYDGVITFEEFVTRYDPNPACEFGQVGDVEVALDPAAMELVVNWQAPSGNIADDATYIIERLAPETVDERRSEWLSNMNVFTSIKREWEDNHFRPWYNQLTNAYKNKYDVRTTTKAKGFFAEMTFDQWWESAGRAYKRSLDIPVPAEDGAPDAESRSMAEKQVWPEIDRVEPKAPPEPSDWEVVATGVSGTEFRDSSFDMNVTYTYAVRMESDIPPTIDHVDNVMTESEKVAMFPESARKFVYKDRTQTQGHPVRVQNRIAINYDGAGGESANFNLETRYKLVDRSGDGTTHTWYRVQIRVTVEGGQPIGDEYSKAELIDRDVKMFDADGAVLNAAELLPDDATVDFDTGFDFIVKVGSDPLLNSPDYDDGDFSLPSETRLPATELDSPVGKENPVEVRALTVKSGAKSGMFELTRWHQLEDGEWIRVVATQNVDKGSDIGMTVDLTNPGRNVKLYDSEGAEFTGVAKGTVDLSAGVFEGLDGRNLKIAGETVDLFGTLYKE